MDSQLRPRPKPQPIESEGFGASKPQSSGGGGGHSHTDSNDPLAWLRESVPGGKESCMNRFMDTDL